MDASKQHPIIVNSRMVDSSLTSKLAQSFRIRVSSECLPDYILPTCSSAAIIVMDFIGDEFTEGMKERIVQMANTFRRSFAMVLLNSDVDCLARFSKLQRCVGSAPILLPCNDEVECFNGICQIAEFHTKEIFERTKEDAKKIKAEMFSPAAIPQILFKNLRFLTLQECKNLHQSLGCIANIATASIEDLIQQGHLSPDKASKVFDFFETDRPAL